MPVPEPVDEPILTEFDENAPVELPEDFEITYTQEWFDKEDELAILGAAFAAEGLINTEKILLSNYN